MHSLRHIISNISWLTIGMVGRMGIVLVVGALVARYLQPDQYGQLNYALAFVALFSAIPGLGLKEILVREFVHAPENRGALIGTAITLQFAFGVIAMIAAVIAASVMKGTNYGSSFIIAIISLSLPLTCISSVSAWYESQVKAKFVTIAQFPAIIIIAAIRVLLVLAKAPLVTFVWITTLETVLVMAIPAYELLLRDIGLKNIRVNFLIAKDLLRESWPLMLSGMSVALYMRLDQVMLGSMSGKEEVGYYAAAAKLSEVWYFIPAIIVSSMNPNILKMKKISHEKYMNGIQQLFYILTLLCLAISVAVCSLSGFIIRILYGSLYAHSAAILSIHSWTLVFVALGLASSSWYVAEKLTKLNLQRSILGLVANVILNLLLIPKYGGVGASLATLLSYIAAAFVADALMDRTRPIFIMKAKSLLLIPNILKLYEQLIDRKNAREI